MKIIPVNNELVSGDPSDTVCYLKWNYPMFNFGRNEYRTCCRSPGNKVSNEELKKLGQDAFLNHPREIQERLDMLTGKKIQSCNQCWKLESSGFKSPREPDRFYYWMKQKGYISNVNWYKPGILNDEVKQLQVKLTDHPILKSTDPHMVEIILGNTCDMKCMYCNHHYSSQWAAERIKYGEIKEEQYLEEFPEPNDLFQEKFWEWFDGARLSLERIGLIGGEPLITPDFYPIVEKLIQRVNEISHLRKSKITIFFVTNLNTNEKYFNKFLNLLPRLIDTFKIEILISQESTGKKAEYIRNGLNWATFDHNVGKLCSLPAEFDIIFMPAVNILSVSSLPEIMKYIIDTSVKYNRPIGIGQNVIGDPNWQSPSLLTPEFAEYTDNAATIVKNSLPILLPISINYAKHENYIKFLINLSKSIKINGDSTEQRKKFVEWFKTYDERRGLNLLETFPEYTDFYEKCKGL